MPLGGKLITEYKGAAGAIAFYTVNIMLVGLGQIAVSEWLDAAS